MHVALRPVDAALSYAARGWPVFPCHGIRESRCSCRTAGCSSPAKHPRVARGLHAASIDPDDVARWWERWPTANIGIRTGDASGVVVLDIDPTHGGSRSIKSLIDRHGDLSTVPRVRTGSAGWHLFFARSGQPIHNSAGRVGEGLDVRGDGGYVIAPPSVHVSGRPYVWEIDPVCLPDLPAWLRELATAPETMRHTRPIGPTRVDRDVSSWASSAFDAEVRHVRSATTGTRNVSLNRSAFALGQIVGAGLLDQGAVERTLIECALDVGLTEREAAMTVRSGLRAGARRPRGPTLSPNLASHQDASSLGATTHDGAEPV
jgi:hypothetical protein